MDDPKLDLSFPPAGRTLGRQTFMPAARGPSL